MKRWGFFPGVSAHEDLPGGRSGQKAVSDSDPSPHEREAGLCSGHRVYHSASPGRKGPRVRMGYQSWRPSAHPRPWPPARPLITQAEVPLKPVSAGRHDPDVQAEWVLVPSHFARWLVPLAGTPKPGSHSQLPGYFQRQGCEYPVMPTCNWMAGSPLHRPSSPGGSPVGTHLPRRLLWDGADPARPRLWGAAERRTQQGQGSQFWPLRYADQTPRLSLTGAQAWNTRVFPGTCLW